MIWPWSKRKDAHRHEVRQDLAAARERLAEAHAVEPLVRNLVRELTTRRERNNFASMIEAAFREHR